MTGLVINNQEDWLFSVSWDKTLKMWNLKTGELIDSLEVHNQGILAVTCNQHQVITGGFDQEIKIWSINSGEKEPLKTERTLTHHSGSIHDLAIASQKDILISGSYDQTIKQWDLKNGDKIGSSLDESGAIYAVDVYEAKKIIVKCIF